MKALLFAVLFSCHGDSAPPPAAAPPPADPTNPALDEGGGFRKFPMGTPRSEMGEMVRMKKYDMSYTHLEAWILKDDYPWLGKSRTSRIVYSFRDDKLANVEVVAEGQEYCDALLAWAESTYGDRAREETAERIRWNGAKVDLMFRVRADPTDCLLIYDASP